MTAVEVGLKRNALIENCCREMETLPSRIFFSRFDWHNHLVLCRWCRYVRNILFIVGGCVFPSASIFMHNVLENSETCRYYSRPLIDYDMVLFLASVEMTGAIIGVLVQSVLPNWLYLMTASLILAVTAQKPYDNWWETPMKEKMATEKYSSTTSTAVAVHGITDQQPYPSTSKYDGESPPIPVMPLEDNSVSNQMDTQSNRLKRFFCCNDLTGNILPKRS